MSRTASTYKSERCSRSGHTVGGTGEDNILGDGEAKIAIPRILHPKSPGSNSCLTRLKVLSPQVHRYSSVPRGKPMKQKRGIGLSKSPGNAGGRATGGKNPVRLA
jgi:hypothetical protein